MRNSGITSHLSSSLSTDKSSYPLTQVLCQLGHLNLRGRRYVVKAVSYVQTPKITNVLGDNFKTFTKSQGKFHNLGHRKKPIPNSRLSFLHPASFRGPPPQCRPTKKHLDPQIVPQLPARIVVPPHLHLRCYCTLLRSRVRKRSKTASWQLTKPFQIMKCVFVSEGALVTGIFKKKRIEMMIKLIIHHLQPHLQPGSFMSGSPLARATGSSRWSLL